MYVPVFPGTLSLLTGSQRERVLELPLESVLQTVLELPPDLSSATISLLS